MSEALVQLVCPECLKDWEADPTDLSSPDASVRCPDCGEGRRLSEFMWTDRDLEVLRVLTDCGQSASPEWRTVANSVRSTSVTSPTDS